MRTVVVFGSLLAACGFAWGADLPAAPPARAPVAYVAAPPPAFSWTGFYAGVNAGAEFLHQNGTVTIAGGLLGPASATGSSNGNSVLVGGQLGFNYQIDPWVFGLEGDMDWSSQANTTTTGPTTVSSKSPWLATIRGRAGYAIDRILVYGTGGVAFRDLSQNASVAGFGTFFSASSVNVGWTAGAGIEAAVLQNVTVRAEYLFVSTNYSLSGPIAVAGGTLTNSGRLTDNVVRVGANYKFW